MRPDGVDREDQVKRTYHNLEVLGNQLATLPGRRDIVWITNIMPKIRNPTPCSGDWVECGLYVAHMGVTLEHDRAAVDPTYFSGEMEPSENYDLEHRPPAMLPTPTWSPTRRLRRIGTTSSTRSASPAGARE